jgi:Smg protein
MDGNDDGPVRKGRNFAWTKPGREMMRVLGPHERGRFAPDAWGHLLALAGAGALNPSELEQVIERAMVQFDGRIALDDLRSMMEGAGFEDPGSAPDTQTVH